MPAHSPASVNGTNRWGTVLPSTVPSRTLIASAASRLPGQHYLRPSAQSSLLKKSGWTCGDSGFQMTAVRPPPSLREKIKINITINSYLNWFASGRLHQKHADLLVTKFRRLLATMPRRGYPYRNSHAKVFAIEEAKCSGCLPAQHGREDSVASDDSADSALHEAVADPTRRYQLRTTFREDGCRTLMVSFSTAKI